MSGGENNDKIFAMVGEKMTKTDMDRHLLCKFLETRFERNTCIGFDKDNEDRERRCPFRNWRECESLCKDYISRSSGKWLVVYIATEEVYERIDNGADVTFRKIPEFMIPLVEFAKDKESEARSYAGNFSKYMINGHTNVKCIFVEA